MKKGMMLLLVGCMLFPGTASALRCGQGLVMVGDVKAKVLAECGEPQYRETVGERESARRKGEGAWKKTTKKVEEWTYNCGEGDFIYVLTFEGGKLVKEEPVARGKGKSRCQGN